MTAKALDKRADKIAKTKWKAKWHEAAERMRLAVGYLALGDRARALELVRPATKVRGSDTYGDTLEWCARDAIACSDGSPMAWPGPRSRRSLRP